MMSLGQITLNVSSLMYVFFYLPQVIHNQKKQHLSGLCRWTHLILYFGYCLDFIYGLGYQLPWQYLVGSGVGCILLTIQHFQLIGHFKQADEQGRLLVFYGISFLPVLIFIWFIKNNSPFSATCIAHIGYAAQFAFAVAFLPQILRFKRSSSIQAINIYTLILWLVLAILDCISAWQLEWGWPYKLGSGLIVLLTTILLSQSYHYSKLPKSASI